MTRLGTRRRKQDARQSRPRILRYKTDKCGNVIFNRRVHNMLHAPQGEQIRVR
jgi:hypothetical protein